MEPKRAALLVVGIAALHACASGPVITPPEEPEPLVVVEPERDVAPVREALEAFLTARWSFDTAAMLSAVTAEDAAAPWPQAVEPADMKIVQPHQRPAVPSWYEWEVRELAYLNDTEARAQVALTQPTMASLAMMSVKSMTGMPFMMMDAMKENPSNPQEVIDARVAGLRPDRVMFETTYHLVLVDGAWKVRMGWPEYEQIRKIEDPAERDAALESFNGSEDWFLRDTPREAVDGQTRRLLSLVDDAERYVNSRQYDKAMEIHDDIAVETDVPAFVRARATFIERHRAAWEARAAAAQVEAGTSRVVPGKRSDSWRFEVPVHNKGPHALTLVEITVDWKDARGHERSARARNSGALAPGEKAVLIDEMRDKAKPSLLSARLTEVRFDDPELEKSNALPRDREFEYQLQDLRSGGQTAQTASRVGSRLHDQYESFDACPGWGEQPIDLGAEVDPRGQLTRVWFGHGEPSPALRQCLEFVASNVQFDPAPSSRRVVVVLYPPDHWTRGRKKAGK